MANIQGKESVKVSEEVINTIIREIVHEKMENSLEKLTEADIKRYLKKHRKLHYYNHTTQILYRITKIPPLQMTPIMEEKMKMRFLQIAQFRYIKIQPKTIDLSTRLVGINPTNSVVIPHEPRAEVYCFRLNFNISKLGYSRAI